MKTVTYQQVLDLAGDLSGRPRGKLPTTESTVLRAYFAAELPDLWNLEAWPELCDNLEVVTLDANNCFDLREGQTDEMGDILALVVGGDPRLGMLRTVLSQSAFVRLDDRVNVQTGITGDLWVDWQLPAPNLLDTDFDDETNLLAYELPERFLLPLAARGAALLVAEENPAQAGVLRGLAQSRLVSDAKRITRPWWRGRP